MVLWCKGPLTGCFYVVCFCALILVFYGLPNLLVLLGCAFQRAFQPSAESAPKLLTPVGVAWLTGDPPRPWS